MDSTPDVPGRVETLGDYFRETARKEALASTSKKPPASTQKQPKPKKTRKNKSTRKPRMTKSVEIPEEVQKARLFIHQKKESHMQDKERWAACQQIVKEFNEQREKAKQEARHRLQQAKRAHRAKSRDIPEGRVLGVSDLLDPA